MAVALRRPFRPSEENAEEKAQEDEAKAAREAERLTQIAACRRDAMDVIGRMGKGMMLWQERQWSWEDPMPESEPETWPPVAKLLWLHARLDWLLHDLEVLISMGDPMWCDPCRGTAGFPGRGWMKGLCSTHAAIHIRGAAGHRALMLLEEVKSK